MEALSIVIVSLMAVAFVAVVIIIIAGWLCDRKAARKVRDKASRYFKQ